MSDHRVIRESSSSQRATNKRNFLKILARPFALIVEHRQRHKAIATLERLDDHLLRDIGISRNDIPRVIDGLLPDEEVRSRSLTSKQSEASWQYQQAA